MKFTYSHTKSASYIGYITQAAVNDLMPLLFAAFQADFGFSVEDLSLLIAVNFGSQMLVDVFGAKYVDKIGYRISLMISHVCSVIGLVGMSILPFLLHPLVGLGLCNIFCAVGAGLCDVMLSPLVESLPNDGRHIAIGFLHSFCCWGQVAVIALSSLCFALFGITSWRILPVMWALVPIANMFLISAVPLPHIAGDGEKCGNKRLSDRKMFRLLALIMLCAGGAEFAMEEWASYFAEVGLGLSKTVGDLLGPCAFALFMGLSRVWYGIRGGRVGIEKLLLISSAMCAAGYIIAALSPFAALALFGCALCGLSVGVMWPGTLSLALSICPEGGTRMFALLALAGEIGCLFGPLLCGGVSGLTSDIRFGMISASVFPIALFLLIKYNINNNNFKCNMYE